MCGIAGILGRMDDANRAALARMQQALAHRGPDASATWTSTPDERGHGCLLAHRRLSILDLSHAADQPMTDRRCGKTLVFNGEIYNYKALRHESIAAGDQIESTGDTEVLFRLLCRNGSDTLKKLRGMFAVAFWDDRQRTLLLARDALGIKPLYVSLNRDSSGGWALVFASEVRAILASGWIEKTRLDSTALASFVWNGFVM